MSVKMAWCVTFAACLLCGVSGAGAADRESGQSVTEASLAEFRQDPRLIELQQRMESGELSQEDAETTLLSMAKEHGVNLDDDFASDVDAHESLSLPMPSLKDQMVEHLLTLPREMDGTLREGDATVSRDSGT